MPVWCFKYCMYLYKSHDEMPICQDCSFRKECESYNKKLQKAMKEGKAILGFEEV